MRFKLIFTAIFLFMLSTMSYAAPNLSGVNVNINFNGYYGGNFQSMTITNFQLFNPNIPHLVGLLDFNSQLDAAIPVLSGGVSLTPAFNILIARDFKPSGNFLMRFSPNISGSPAGLFIQTLVTINNNGTISIPSPSQFKIGTAACQLSVTNGNTITFTCSDAE